MLAWGGGAVSCARAQAPRDAVADPADYRSTHVVLHTDLPAREARELLARLESILGLIAKYWGQPLEGEIECYVVRDLSVWPAGAISDIGRAKIRASSGITTTQTVNRGRQFVAGKSTVYSIADGGTPQHEIVHAYCGQTFGRTGPLWYSEGMAELGQFWQEDNTGVRCKPHMIDYLNRQATKTVAQIVAEDAADGHSTGPVRTGDSWQAYACRWALCHLLVNNPNYAGRFRTLGLAYLHGSQPRFDEVFGVMSRELEFEYRLFIKQVDQGYRADLCRWDWHHKFRPAERTPTTARIMANRGWQASGGAGVARAGLRLQRRAIGNWGPAEEKRPRPDSRMEQGDWKRSCFTISSLASLCRFRTTAHSSRRPTGSYSCCHESWNELADNTGFVTVKIRKSDHSPAEPRPLGTAGVRLPGPSDAGQ